MFKKHLIFCLAMCGCLATSLTYALSSDARQVIHIEADQAKLDNSQLFTTYQGNVVATQGTLKIQAEKITVHYDAQQKLKTLIAIGTEKNPAHFQQQMDNDPDPVHAYAVELTYQAKQQKIILKQQARISQAGNEFKGSHIVYDASNSQITADQGRVSATILPPPQSK